MNTLHVWKLWEEANLPTYASEWAACFDIYASLRSGDQVTVYDEKNEKIKRPIVNRTVALFKRERMLIPTGLVFDLEENQSLRIHPRSGLSLKSGVAIANCEGVVDADYVQQTFVMLYNSSLKCFEIEDGMRVAQGEIVETHQHKIIESDREPENKSSRKGGFGSTGI